EVSDTAFTAASSALVDDPILEPNTVRTLSLSFTAADINPVRELLSITSNDPDEPVVPVALLANRTTPCVGSFTPGQPFWQMHPGDGPMCWPTVSRSHGHIAEYEHASVPQFDDPGWLPEPDDHISFERRSTLC